MSWKLNLTGCSLTFYAGYGFAKLFKCISGYLFKTSVWLPLHSQQLALFHTRILSYPRAYTFTEDFNFFLSFISCFLSWKKILQSFGSRPSLNNTTWHGLYNDLEAIQLNLLFFSSRYQCVSLRFIQVIYCLNGIPHRFHKCVSTSYYDSQQRGFMKKLTSWLVGWLACFLFLERKIICCSKI